MDIGIEGLYFNLPIDEDIGNIKGKGRKKLEWI